MERETGFEPATPTLARLCSTTELFPLFENKNSKIPISCQLLEPDEGGILIQATHILYNKKEKIKELFGSKGIPPGINVKFPKYFPPIMNLSVDEEGRIFVGTYEKVKNKKGYYFDVFDAEGRYISKVPLNIKPKQWFKWKNKKLYVVEKTERGFPLIKSYRVIWY